MTDALWSLITTPWTLQPDTLLGATVLALAAALLGEAVWRILRWPRLIGYVLVGAALALSGRGADGDEPALRVAIDGALALLLFEAGARLKLRWLARNPWLLATSVAESLLTGIAVYAALRSLGIAAEACAPLAIVAVCVSPAVLQRVVGELHAAGQVTERLLALAALNTLYAVLAMKLLSAGWLLSDPRTWLDALSPVLFSFCGSILLGAALGEGLALIARRFDLREDNSVVLLLAAVLLALVVAKTLQLSSLLVPLLAGIWLANRSERPWIWPRHFGSAGGVLVLVMFVAVASAWTPQVLAQAALPAAGLVLARLLAKAAAVIALARPSGLGFGQAACLATGLLPLSATAWVLALDFTARHPAIGGTLMPVLLAALAMLELLAPLAVMASLRTAGEVDLPPRGHGAR
ncbi:MAG TPA: cation:proton antiporter [Burkholderiaceae bacterium]|nr:cation:proton antiporter [Burkholderiaceae bacterium]